MRGGGRLFRISNSTGALNRGRVLIRGRALIRGRVLIRGNMVHIHMNARTYTFICTHKQTACFWSVEFLFFVLVGTNMKQDESQPWRCLLQYSRLSLRLVFKQTNIAHLNFLLKLSVLCAPSNHLRLFSYHAKMADFEYFCVLPVFS